MIVLFVLFVLYGGLVLIASTNLILMRRPSGSSPICFEVMIPARNEESNLGLVIPPLVGSGVKVTVFDDESTDRTAEIAHDLGAKALTAKEVLPPGWTGKNLACHELSLLETEEWVVFLDADTIPDVEFGSALSAFLSSRADDIKVVSGFPKMLPGRGLEPAYLGWVPWVLLAANPFGIVARTRMGHGRFTNGQIVAWRRETVRDLLPFDTLKGEILEDVKIGRMLAKRNERVEIANLSRILSVRMYWTLQEAIDGMSKNSGHIGGGFMGSFAFSLLMMIFGWGWLLGGHWWWLFLGLLLFSKFLTDRVVRAPVWTIPFIPLTCLAASLTVIRSLVWIRKRSVRWKGRIYES